MLTNNMADTGCGLRNCFKHDPDNWDEFKRYFKALDRREEWIQQLAEKARLSSLVRTKGKVMYRPGKLIGALISRYVWGNEIHLIGMETTARRTFK